MCGGALLVNLDFSGLNNLVNPYFTGLHSLESIGNIQNRRIIQRILNMYPRVTPLYPQRPLLFVDEHVAIIFKNDRDIIRFDSDDC
jgi:hypothetical protein